MALLHVDGFELYNNSTDILLAYSNASGAIGISTSIFRTGARSFIVSDGARYIETNTLPVSGATFVGGAAFRYASSLVSLQPNFIVMEGATVHMDCIVNSDGSISVRRGTSTTLATSAAGVIVVDTWYYIEFKVVINDTVGTYEVKVDAVSKVSGTGADTQNGGTSTWTKARIGSGANIDDLYICDGSGSLNNTFLGNCQVEVIRPQTDAVAAGTNSDFTPSSGSDNGAMVDETTQDGDTTYNAGTAAAQKDTYNYPALALTGTILGIKIAPVERKTDAGVRTTCTVVRSNGADYDHADAISPSTSYRMDSQIWETDPDTTLSWTSAGVNAAEFGLKVVS